MRAGLWREWQAAIFLRYGLILAMAVPVFFYGWRWLAAPVLLWFWSLVARGTRSLRKNRACYPASHLRNLARLGALVPILATLDAAVFAGSINWLLLDKLRLGGAKQEDVHRG